MKKSVIKALSVLFVGLFMVAACKKKEATGKATGTETGKETGTETKTTTEE